MKNPNRDLYVTILTALKIHGVRTVMQYFEFEDIVAALRHQEMWEYYNENNQISQ
jgi:hypothetical protein